MTKRSETKPGIQTGPRKASRSDRVIAALLATGCLTVLSIAAWLSPDAAGHGTHTQLGMSECAWAVHFDAPCATCGMTTSFSHAAAGQWQASVVTQPFGTALVILASILFWGGLHVSMTGSRLGSAVAPVLTSKALFFGGALFLLAWGYKWVTW